MDHQSWERIVSTAKKGITEARGYGRIGPGDGNGEPGTWLIRTHSRIDSVSNMYPGQRHETMRLCKWWKWVGAGIRQKHTSSRRAGGQADGELGRQREVQVWGGVDSPPVQCWIVIVLWAGSYAQTPMAEIRFRETAEVNLGEGKRRVSKRHFMAAGPRDGCGAELL